MHESLGPKGWYVALLLSAAAGCASSQLRPTLVSPADSTGYATRYPELLSAEADTFAAHKKQAHELSTSIEAHAREPKPAGQSALLTQVVDQADADGRRESFARAQREDVVLRQFWDDERGPISSRASGAVQKQITDANCTNVADTQPAIQQAMRASVDRQLEKHLRAESEAHRLLEQSKAQLPQPVFVSMQRLVDDITLNSYLANVALVEDADALNHRAAEYSSVESTLQRSLEQERQAQVNAHTPADQKASQERTQQLSASQASLAKSRDKASAELTNYEQQVQAARDEYARALAGVKVALAPPPPAAAAK
ncbi:MAG TPA: hypothetical protein VJV78_49860 [Polyangiales bacterium]|nr:hypothetical protein [Polyangiales bacterium]